MNYSDMDSGRWDKPKDIITGWSKVKVKVMVAEPFNALLILGYVYQTPAKMTARG